MNLKYPHIFDISKLTYMKRNLLTLFLVFIVMNISAQKLITGKVTFADNNEPVPGANIINKGTNAGTVTDANGNFRINASEKDILQVSFIGYLTEKIEVGTNDFIEVMLVADITCLSDVVVVGYGVQLKKDLTGSVATIKGENLMKQPALSPVSSLQGQMSGVQVVNNGTPGSAPMIRIRGVGTILGGVDPLYVVDGVITGDIRNINSSDIVSVDILKDASSAAIYGARAANGVVLITTKAGEKKESSVSYEGLIGLKVPENKVDMADTRFYAEYTNEALERDGRAAYFDLNNLPATNTNWFNEITHVAKVQNHTIAVSGGNDNATHYFSLGYLDEEGLMIKNDYQRITARLNNTYNLLDDHVTVGSNFNISGYKSVNAPAVAFNQAYRYPPTVPVKDTAGNFGYTYQVNLGNPVATIEYTNEESWGERILADAWAEIVFLKDFTYKLNIGLDKGENNGRSYIPVYHVSNIQENPDDTSDYYRSKNDNTNWLIDNTVNYSKIVGKHDLKILAGTTAEKKSSEALGAYRADVPAEENYWYLNLGRNTDPTNFGYGDKETRRSFLGRINYIYDEKYLLTANFRADGSSKFSEKNRWGYFPSFGIGWRLSQEQFIKNIPWIYNLKLRLNWGKIGNDNISSNEFVYTVTSNLNYVFGTNQNASQGATIKQIKDLNLRWEITEEKGIGIDYSLFNGMLSGEIEYYEKLTTDALIYAPVAAVFGDEDNTFLTNKANVSNKGLEFVINLVQEFSQFGFNAGVSGTYNKNRIENISDALPIISGGLNNGQVTTRTEVGQPIGSFWLWETDGVFHSQEEIENYTDSAGNPIQPSALPGDLKYKDNDGDGSIDEGDRIYAGSYQPKFYFGFSCGVTYKSFDIGMIWYGSLGSKIYNGLKAQRWGNENIVASLEDRWTINNTESDIPRASNDVPIASTYYLESGNMLRLNSVILGYTLPQSMTSKIKLNRLRIYATAQNPITFKKYSGFTTELPGGSLDSGIELNAYPTTSTYVIGINVEF